MDIKKLKIKIMKDTILKLKTMLPAQDFIVTGSYVLSQYGLMNQVDDIDIILVKPEPSTIEMINRFMKDFPAKSTERLLSIPVPEKKEPTKATEEYEDFDDEIPKPKSKFGFKVAAAPKNSFIQAIFMFDNKKIDIFVENNFSETTLIVDGIKYTTIPHIIKAKQTYGRMKDWLQCRDMARIIFDSDTFNGILNNDWKNLIRDNY